MATSVGWQGVALLYLESFIGPFRTLWLIYLLSIFFVVTRHSRGAPSLGGWFVAAALEMMHVQTGWTAIDEVCARIVYFYSGYLCAATIFRLAASANKNPGVASVGVAAWALSNHWAVKAGVAAWPVVSLALGYAGPAQ